jgi:hypothetical protein
MRKRWFIVLFFGIVLAVVFVRKGEKAPITEEVVAKASVAPPRATTGSKSELSASSRDGKPMDLKAARTDDWLDDEQRGYLLTSLVEWSERNHKDAIAYLDTIPEQARTEATRELAAALMAEKPNESWKLLAKLPRHPLTDQMMQQWVMEFTAKSPQQAVDWALSQNDAAERTQLLSAVLCAHASQEPAKAESLAREHLPVGPEQNKLFVEITQRWVQLDPLPAAEFVKTLSGSTAADAVRAFVPLWPTEEIPKLKIWYASLPDGESKEAALEAMPALAE